MFRVVIGRSFVDCGVLQITGETVIINIRAVVIVDPAVVGTPLTLRLVERDKGFVVVTFLEVFVGGNTHRIDERFLSGINRRNRRFVFRQGFFVGDFLWAYSRRNIVAHTGV